METSPHGDDTCQPYTYSPLELLWAQQQPLVQKLLLCYGTTPELRRDLPGEIYYRLSQLVAGFDPALGLPLDAYLVRALPVQISCYVCDYWVGEPHLATAATSDAGVLPGGSEEPVELQILPLPAAALRGFPGYLARLPHRQRLVLVWKHHEGHSDAEIAQRLGTSVSAVAELLRLALRSLQSQVQGPGVDR